MNKRFIVLLLALCMTMGIIPMTYGQDEADDPMWASILLTPDNTKLKQLEENIKAHNKKFNKEGPRQSSIYNIVTGPNAGKIVWMMGPLTFTDLDTPGEAGARESWRDNIMPYVKKMSHGEFWQGDMKLSNTSMMDGDPSKYPLVFVRYWKIELGHGHNIENMLKMVSETVKAMEGENPWGVYYNLFRQGDMGRHVATVGFSKNWAEYDEDPTFKKTFLKTHGENSWDGFVRNMDMTFEDSWDEIWRYNKEMSGN